MSANMTTAFSPTVPSVDLILKSYWMKFLLIKLTVIAAGGVAAILVADGNANV